MEFHTIYSIHAAGGTWHAGSRRIKTISWARLNTTLFPTVEHLFFSPTLLAAYQKQTEPKLLPQPTLWLPNTSINRSPLYTANKPLRWCQNVKAFCGTLSCSLLFQTKLLSFLQKPAHVQDKQTQKRQLRKSDLSLRLQSTLMPLFAGHICIWVTKGSIRKGWVSARTHPPFRLSLLSVWSRDSLHNVDTAHPLQSGPCHI